MNELLGRLVGQRLLSVEFVLDYAQLKFDNDRGEAFPLLTCDVLPTVTIADRTYVAAEVEWPQAIRSLIGQVVTETREGFGDGLQVELEGGLIRFRPTAEELVGPEIAMLNGFDDARWMVWRPGEEAFEYL
jgi:hypothetical protein